MARGKEAVAQEAIRIPAKRIAQSINRSGIVQLRIAEDTAGIERNLRLAEPGHQGWISECCRWIVGLRHPAWIGSPEIRRRVFIDGKNAGMGSKSGSGKQGGTATHG